MAKKKWKSSEMVELLKGKYPKQKYALITEVPNGTSDNKSRTADAIAMGCWKTVGIHLSGFEIKVSRSDWRNELNDLSKSAVFQKHCHRWWIVAAPGIVQVEEMPAEWGLMEPFGNGLRVKRAAALTSPEPVEFNFLAALLRRACIYSESESEIKKAHQKGYREGVEAGKRQSTQSLMWDNDQLKRDYDHLKERVDKFQELSGVDIDVWRVEEIGKAVRLLVKLSKSESLSRQFDGLLEMSSNVTEAVKELQTCIGLLDIESGIEQESN